MTDAQVDSAITQFYVDIANAPTYEPSFKDIYGISFTAALGWLAVAIIGIAMVIGIIYKVKRGRAKWLNEIISIPLGLAAFYFYPLLAMQLEDNPAVWGVGALQIIVFAFALSAIANGFGGIFVKVVVPNIFRFKDNEFEFAFTQINPFQKCVLLLLWFTVYFFGFIIAATAL